MLWIELQSLLGNHIAGCGRVSEGLCLHDTLHVADQPYSEVTRTHGDSSILVPRTTFSTLSPRMSFISLQRDSNLAFSSSLFFFSSSVSSMSRPSLVTDLSFLSS